MNNNFKKLQEMLKDLNNKEINELCKKLNYNKKTFNKCAKRINNIINYKNLKKYIEKEAYDLKYTGKEFLLKLGKIFDIELGADIKKAKKEINKLNKMFPAYILFHTNFKPNNWMSAMILNRFKVNIDKELIKNKTLEEQLELLKPFIKKYIEKYKKDKILSEKIKITGITYYYDFDKKIDLDINNYL